MPMDMAARAMAKQAEDKAVKQASAKTTATDKRIFPLPNVTDGSLSVDGVKGKTVQNILGEGFSNNSLWEAPSLFTRLGDGFASLQLGRDIRTKVNTIPIKPSTLYTLVTEVRKNTLNAAFHFIGSNAQNISPFVATKAFDPGVTGIFKNTIMSVADMSTVNRGIWFHTGVASSGELEVKFMILEGDWTNKEIPPYFEGIKSVGEDTGKLSVKSIGPNILDPDSWIRKGLTWLAGVEYDSPDRTVSGWIDVIPGATVYLKTKDDSNALIPFLYDKDFNYLGCGTVGFKSTMGPMRTYKVEPNVRKMRVVYNNNTDMDLARQAAVYYVQTNKYEPYKQPSLLEIPLTEPLRSLPNGVADEIKDGKIIRRVGKYILDGTKNFDTMEDIGNVYRMKFSIFDSKINVIDYGNLSTISDKIGKVTRDYHTINQEHYYFSGNKQVFIFIEKSKISAFTQEGAKSYFNLNNVIFYYELEQPIETPLTLPSAKSFTNGMVTVENNIWPNEVTVSYSTNVVARITTSENTLGGVLAATLTLADKELAMKSVTTLATGATVTDAVNKINQILNIWR